MSVENTEEDATDGDEGGPITNKDRMDSIDEPQLKKYAKHVFRHKEGDTARRYLGDLQEYEQWLERESIGSAKEVTSDDAYEYCDWVAYEYSPPTAVKRIRLVNRAYMHVLRRRDIDQNPFAGWAASLSEFNLSATKTRQEMELDDEDDYYAPTDADVREMIEHAPTPTVECKLQIMLQASTGLRVGELETLELDDINMTNQTVFIPSKKSKSTNKRYVPFGDELEALLRKYVNDGYRDRKMHADSTYLFAASRGDKGHVTRYTMNKRVRKAAFNAPSVDNPVLYYDAKGDPRYLISSHNLRHYYATKLVNSGVPIYMAAKTLGHSQIATTERYLHENWDKIVSQVPPVSV